MFEQTWQFKEVRIKIFTLHDRTNYFITAYYAIEQCARHIRFFVHSAPLAVGPSRHCFR